MSVCVYEYCDFEVIYNLESAIHDWIHDNLKGKFIVTKAMNTEQKSVMRVGFEDGKEMSYFMLACPLLRYK